VYNPLFVYGGTGLGKTHLLCAVGHLASALQPDLEVEYVSLDEFVEQRFSEACVVVDEGQDCPRIFLAVLAQHAAVLWVFCDPQQVHWNNYSSAYPPGDIGEWSISQLTAVLRPTRGVFDKLRLTINPPIPLQHEFLHEALFAASQAAYVPVAFEELTTIASLIDHEAAMRPLRLALSAGCKTFAFLYYPVERKKFALDAGLKSLARRCIGEPIVAEGYDQRSEAVVVVVDTIKRLAGLAADVVLLVSEQDPAADLAPHSPNELYLGIGRAKQLVIHVAPRAILDSFRARAAAEGLLREPVLRTPPPKRLRLQAAPAQ